MMVDSSPFTHNSVQFEKELINLANQIEGVSRSSKPLSESEIRELTNKIEAFNSTLNEGFWKDKKLSPEKSHSTIEKALLAIALFQGKRNIDQAIVSLTASLRSALLAFDKNLRDLKKIRIGRKISKSGESKHS